LIHKGWQISESAVDNFFWQFIAWLSVVYLDAVEFRDHRRAITSWAQITPVILATQEAEIRRIVVQSKSGKIVCETLSRKIFHKNKASEVAPGEDPAKKKKKKAITLYVLLRAQARLNTGSKGKSQINPIG
jgi:hypothetical protein